MSKMLSTEQILNAKFTPVSKGTYSAEEVDAFLNTVAESYENSLNNNQELIKKISILADKIESYRNDEEAIKLALLDAHKMAENVNKTANEKAETLVSEAEGRAKIILDGANRQSAQMIDDAKEKAKEIVDNARTAVASLTERAQIETDNTIAEAKKKAAEIVANAEEKGREIIGTSKQSYEFYSAELEKIQDETSKFKATIEEICKGQLNLLGDIPGSFAAVVSAAASIPAVASVVAEEPAEEEAVEETAEETAEVLAAEPVADAFDEIIEEINVSQPVEEIPEVDAETEAEPEEEHDASALALMAEINGLAADVMNVVEDPVYAEPVYEEEIGSEGDYVQQEFVSEVDDDDDLFGMIDDVEFDNISEPDSIPSSLDDLIPDVLFASEEKEEEFAADFDDDFSEELQLEENDDGDDEFRGFQIDLDSITDDDDNDDDDITSLFDSLFDD